jgi:ParB/RepB/Spo0J family partition protein
MADESEMVLWPIDKITVGPRYRQDLGDIAGLAKSIQAVGLLQPIVLTPHGELVAGGRRLEALKQLALEEPAFKEVQAYVVTNLDDALLRLRAEGDENTCRKDFTPSEAAAIGERLEQLEREAAKERQKATRAKKGQKVGQNTAVKGAEKFSAPSGRSGKGSTSVHQGKTGWSRQYPICLSRTPRREGVRVAHPRGPSAMSREPFVSRPVIFWPTRRSCRATGGSRPADGGRRCSESCCGPWRQPSSPWSRLAPCWGSGSASSSPAELPAAVGRPAPQ